MRILLFLILFIIVLIFAPMLFLDIFLISGVLIQEVVTDSILWAVMIALAGIFALAILHGIYQVIKSEIKRARAKREK